MKRLGFSRIVLTLIWLGTIFLQIGPGIARISASDAEAHFHHVHLNVTDSKATQEFYQRYFGALPIPYRNATPSLFTERSFLLLTEATEAPRTHHKTCLWHLGWAGVDGPSEFRWRQEAGVKVHTPLTALGDDHYMYFSGPQDEWVEVYTGSRNHRFEHIHLLATDVNQTIQWFTQTLGLKARRETVPQPPADADVNSLRGIWMNTIRVDNVNLVVFGRPRAGTTPFWLPEALPDEFAPTKGSTIDHIAFSYRNIEPEFTRMKESGIKIERPIKVDPETGHRSFFVLAPNQLLVEIVEAKPIPEGLWE